MDALVDQLFRRQSGRLVGVLTRQLGAHRLSLAEDAVQDALVKALQAWPLGGVPDNPTAWLYQVARRAALDRLRHERVVEAKADAVAAGPRRRRAALPEHVGAVRRRRAGHDVHDLPSGAGRPTRASRSP